MEIFKARLRKIGSSIGVLVPKEQLESLEVEAGDEVEISLLRHRNPAEIKAGFGMAKRFSKSFERDKKHREF